jgi:hypothetical protein
LERSLLDLTGTGGVGNYTLQNKNQSVVIQKTTGFYYNQ